MPEGLGALALELRGGASPAGACVLKRNAVRCVARVGDVLLKVWTEPRGEAERERRALARARARGLPVSEPRARGDGWLALGFVAGREATRADLPALLELAARMHGAGMLHGDFHLGNLRITASGPLLLDLQRARFLPWVPRWLRERELGFLAFSLGAPLPAALSHVRGWCERRGRRHWRSRTRRCVEESSGFTRFRFEGQEGFRRRSAAASELEAALAQAGATEPFKRGRRSSLWRCGGLWVKRFARARDARAAWIAGHGLEVRGIATARALARAGPWLLMEDAGPTLSDWVEREFAGSPEPVRIELADALGALLARLHARGVYHADLKANNLCWSPGAPPRLLDYGRVRFRARVPRRRRVKNLAQLNAALPDLIPNALRERALERYLRELGGEEDAAGLRREVVSLSLARRHRWGGG